MFFGIFRIKRYLYFFSLIALLIFFFLVSFLKAEDELDVCGEVPLYLGRYVAPNILFIVDLSGSMAYGLRPDWSPVYNASENYAGFYTDQGFKNYVFNRVYYDGYFEVYPCSDSILHLVDEFLTDECYDYLSSIDSLDNVYIDEILSTYGIADWSYHFYNNGPPYAEEYYAFYNCPYIYEDDTVALGNYLNTMRIEVVSSVIKDLVQDASLSIGLGFFKAYFPYSKYYTRIYEGIKLYSAEHVNNLISILDNVAHEPFFCENNDYTCYRVNVGGGTPFSPSIIAAREYFSGNFTDEDGQIYSPGECAKKFAIFLTDGIGNIDSSVSNVRTRTRDLVNSGVTVVAVGFNLPEDQDAQLRAMAQVANQEADGENTYALHRDQDGDGVPDPFIARNPQELAETLRSIIYEIKQTVFSTGTGAARQTEVGNMVLWTKFDVTDWTGEIRSGHFAFNCANCHTPADVRSLARWNYYKDLDEDGHLDLVNEDLDGDGKLDTVIEDKNGNGVLDEGEDVDNDGHLDVKEDIDGDGHLDTPEPIDWEKLEEFLSDLSQVKAKMGEEAVKNYSSAKIDTIISILKGEIEDSFWWSMEEGWSSTEELSCNSVRNIKYGPEMQNFSGTVSPLSAEQVAFIRGERGCGAPDEEFRSRSKPLGDIINSQPKVWKNLVWIAANDGMLHAFDVETGEEKFAYIPDIMLERYIEASYFTVGYCHQFFFDGTPAIQEVNGRDILVVGLGRGGPYFIALDITNAPEGVSFKWEFTDPDLGETWNEATLAKCEDGKWVAFLPSGYAVNDADWPNKKAYFYALDLNSGSKLAKVSLGEDTPNMASSATPVYNDNTEGLDYIYVGDLQGNLWRFSGCELSSPCRILSLGLQHPVSARVAVSFLPDSSKTWVYLGTGKYWDINDITDTSSQYLIGFLDNLNSCTAPTLDNIEISYSGEYIIPSSCSTNGNGWKVTLRPGERVVTPPTVFGGTVFFLTFLPSGDECSGTGDTWLYALDYQKGCLGSPRLDINGDSKVDENDLVAGKAPIGLYVGKGVPVSPVTFINKNIARVTTTEAIKSFYVETKDFWFQKGSWTDVDIEIH